MKLKIAVKEKRWHMSPREIAFASLGWVLNPIVQRILRNKHTYLKIVEDVHVTTDWKEYASETPMKFNRNFQEVFIRIENCRKRMNGSALILADGTKVKPEIQIIDEFGNSYYLRSGSYSVSPEGLESKFMLVSRAGYRGDLPKDRNYKSILIRADKPFQCSEIVWHNYNLK